MAIKLERLFMKINNELSVYFKIPFFKYFIGYERKYKSLVLIYKVFNEKFELYEWKVI
jgi:hypothetical protein